MKKQLAEKEREELARKLAIREKEIKENLKKEFDAKMRKHLEEQKLGMERAKEELALKIQKNTQSFLK